MGLFTIVPAWIVQDLFVYLAAIALVLFILRREKEPQSILLEMLAFVVVYAAVYENFATIRGFYGYGRTLIMIGNVPLTVPLVEYLVVYSSLRMLGAMKIPTWTKPLVVGFVAVLFDFALDPLAIKLVYPTLEGTVGRWTWFMGPGDVGIYGEPVFNFSGWMLICGYAAVFLLLGRWWHRRSGYARAVGIIYPVIAMIPALLLVVSPLSNFLLWLGPIFAKGGAGEWVMLGAWLTVPIIVLAAAWRGRMKEPFTWKQNAPVVFTLAGLPVITVVSTILYGFTGIVWMEAAASAVIIALLGAVTVAGASRPTSAPSRS